MTFEEFSHRQYSCRRDNIFENFKLEYSKSTCYFIK